MKTIRINSSTNEFDNIFLFTYNSIEGRKDLITSFAQVIPDLSGEKLIKYVVSDILPIDYWNFRYFAWFSGTTSYTILSNREIPSTLEVKELTVHKITRSGKQFYFTHSNLFPDKMIARSKITFSKDNCSIFNYNFYFDGSNTVGSAIITPVKIPQEILAGNPDFLSIDSLDWVSSQYSQVYTNLPDNSPLESLIKSQLIWTEKNTSTSDFTFEVFSIGL